MLLCCHGYLFLEHTGGSLTVCDSEKKKEEKPELPVWVYAALSGNIACTVLKFLRVIPSEVRPDWVTAGPGLPGKAPLWLPVRLDAQEGQPSSWSGSSMWGHIATAAGEGWGERIGSGKWQEIRNWWVTGRSRIGNQESGQGGRLEASGRLGRLRRAGDCHPVGESDIESVTPSGG